MSCSFRRDVCSRSSSTYSSSASFTSLSSLSLFFVPPFSSSSSYLCFFAVSFRGDPSARLRCIPCPSYLRRRRVRTLTHNLVPVMVEDQSKDLPLKLTGDPMGDLAHQNQ